MDKEQIRKQLEDNGITADTLFACLIQRESCCVQLEERLNDYGNIRYAKQLQEFMDDCSILYKGLQEIFPDGLVIKPDNPMFRRGGGIIYPSKNIVSFVVGKVESLLKEVGD